MNNTPRHQATPRYDAILGIFLLLLIAALTGAAHRIASGRSALLSSLPSDSGRSVGPGGVSQRSSAMAIVNRELDRALRRRFALVDRLGFLDRRGMHLIAPWPIGASLGMTHDETGQALATLVGVGWIARVAREGGERVALTVLGLARC